MGLLRALHSTEVRSAVVSTRARQVPGLVESLAISPILLLVRVNMVTIGLLIAGIVASSLTFRVILLNCQAIEIKNFQVFGILASLVGLVAGVGLLDLAHLLVLLVIVISISHLCYWTLTHLLKANPIGKPRSQTALQSTNLGIWLPCALFGMGWQSLGYYSLALVLSKLLGFGDKKRFLPLSRSVIVTTGFTLSLFASRYSDGQYWISVDQLWRASVASGLSTWGYEDFSGAVGATIRYHWLGEATAGIISKYSSSNAVYGVTKLLPVLGVVMSLVGLHQLGKQLGFSHRACMLSGLATIVLCKEFEVFTISSLWGFGLFIAGVSLVLQLARSEGPIQTNHWAIAVLLVVLTPLITMSQSTLGLHFTLLTCFAMAAVAVRRRTASFPLLIVFVVQVAAVLLLRSSLLSSSKADMYSPLISPSNLLQFRGLDIYTGDSRLLITASSILFLLILSQKCVGLLLLIRMDHTRPEILFLLALTALASLLPANLISMGGFESQQSRFLSPLQVLVVFVSFLLLIEALLELRRSELTVQKIFFASLLCTGCCVAISLSRLVYTADWSPARSVGIGVSILVGQGVAILIWWLNFRAAGNAGNQRLIPLVSLLCIALFAQSRNVSNLIEYQTTATQSSRAIEFTGGKETQACFQTLRSLTDRNTIIASNWFRTPPPARSPKNFLVSAHTERRVFLEGPEYVRYWVEASTRDVPRGFDWVDDRYQATDNFAERASKEGYESLRAANVEYFVFETYMPAPPTWEPYADVVFERDTCKILKLRT